MIRNKIFQRSLYMYVAAKYRSCNQGDKDTSSIDLSEDNVSKSDWAAGEKQDFVLLPLSTKQSCFVAMLKT